MKRFLKRGFLFAMLLFVLIGGVCLAEIAAEILAYRKELMAPADATVFVCGDSRTEKGLDPAFWPGLFNFSVSGRPFEQTYLMAKDIVVANPCRFKILLVDISPERARCDYDEPVGKMACPQFFLLYFLHLDERLRPLDGIAGVFRDAMVEKRLRLVWRVIRGKKSFRSSLAGGYVNKDCCLKMTSPDVFSRRARRLSEETQELFSEPSRKERYFDLINRIVGWGRANGIEVVLLTLPWHPDLVRMAGSENVFRFTDTVSEFARRNGCRYLNLMGTPLPEDCWMDGNHVNGKGAARVTELVRTWLTGEGRP